MQSMVQSSVRSKQTILKLNVTRWLPLICCPVIVFILGTAWPAWIYMWSLAFSIFAGLKWLSYADCTSKQEASLWLTLGYLLLWPGMDANSFFGNQKRVETPSIAECVFAFCKIVFGLILLAIAIQILNHNLFIAGWIGLAGIAFTLHFGWFHMLSICWRLAGVNAAPIMNAPILAT